MNREPSNPVRLERPDHNISRSLIDPDVIWILRQLRRGGYKAFLVGGAVRDILLGREPKDFDIGTDARLSEIRHLFRNCRLIGRRFRIAHIFFRKKGEPEKIVEVSTFRSSQKMESTEDLHPEDVDLTGSAYGTPEEDAWRRDFTINALFYDAGDFSVVDHTGGLKDLEARLIRLIGDPDDRFAEDPVRMLRAIEFAVRLDFEIETATREGITRNARRIIEASPARLREEFRQMQARGIMGDVLERALDLGLFSPLFPMLTETGGVFNLLRRLDAKAVDGGQAEEYAYVAALSLPTMLARCPFAPDTGLEEASEAAHDVVGELCTHYQISAHIRHLARELLLGCYRIAKGKAYRTKGRYVKRADFTVAFEFFCTWNEAGGGFDDVVAYWKEYLGQRERPQGERSQGERPAGGGGRRRRSRRPRRRGPKPSSSPGTAD